MSLLERFKKGLARSREGFSRRLDHLFHRGEIDEEFYLELEEVLIAGDVGVETGLKLVDQLKEEVGRARLKERAAARELLVQLIAARLSAPEAAPLPEERPRVILLVGVNGSGKTTTAAKLAHRYRQEGEKVMLVAGDTFRAAAIEQLEIWASRAGVDLVKQQAGSDPSAVFFDALHAALARKTDVVIGDTAGRLHTKVNLMEELKKIHRVIGRIVPGAPHQVLLVLDATTGHNGLAQAARFHEAVTVDGVVLTKLDGTARGGIVVAVREALDLPVRYVGIGEKMEDLEPFQPEEFTRALLE
ncbi:MAG: signal recognition particle-docking protein FtsY [Firmicutes bacterium]|nr:signal recognition particle-docking protein FtsY [Bacillota bacterium]